MKNEIHFGVLLKPDAFSESTLFSHEQFSDCLLSINSILSSDHFITNKFLLSNSIYAHQGSLRQISERGLSEISFSFPISNKLKIINSIPETVTEVEKSKTTYTISEIIRRLITLFTFQIESFQDFIFDANDCSTIYLAISENDIELFKSIQLYLVNKKCRIYFLSGNQSITAIEYIKTFVRYFFKYKQGEKHRLENYIHSLNEVEAKYFLEKYLSN